MVCRGGRSVSFVEHQGGRGGAVSSTPDPFRLQRTGSIEAESGLEKEQSMLTTFAADSCRGDREVLQMRNQRSQTAAEKHTGKLIVRARLL